MSGWICPACKTKHKGGDYPDHWLTGRIRANNCFDFECVCGATFDVEVDFEPQFTVIPSTVRHKQEAQP